MLKIICVTQRQLAGNFLEQVKKICGAGIDRLILREKDLDKASYEALAVKVMEICAAYNVPLSLHTHIDIAKRLGTGIHLTFSDFMAAERSDTLTEGLSVHSLGEAMAADDNVPSYLIAGHIFPTDCKKGKPPMGIDRLSHICGCVKVPVYAIGGITPENAAKCAAAGAAGVCVMSGLMAAEDPSEYIRGLAG